MVNSRYPRFSATPFRSPGKLVHVMRAHLLPKLRCHFAEFLNQSSLERLGIFSPPTCVGLQYGRHSGTLTRSFSWKRGIIELMAPKSQPHHLSALGTRLWPLPPTLPAYGLEPPSIRGLDYPPPSLLVKPSVPVQECSPASHHLRLSASA